MHHEEPAAPPSPQKCSVLFCRARSIIERGDAAALKDLCQRNPEMLTSQVLDSVYLPTLLHITAVKGKRALARLLIDMGAPVDAPDARGETALCYCCTIAHFNRRTGDLASDLVLRGSQVNRRDKLGRTALMHAVVRGCNDALRVKRVELLLRLGADPLIRDHQGKRALDLLGMTTDDGVVLYQALPDRRSEVERCRKILQAAMDRRTVLLLLLLLRRSVFGPEWTKASAAARPAISKQQGSARVTRRRPASAPPKTDGCVFKEDTVAARLVCMADKVLFRHCVEYL